MSIRYYRYNLAALTSSELIGSTHGRRRLYLPYYLARLAYWKMLGRPVTGKKLLPDHFLISQLNEDAIAILRKRHDCVEACQSVWTTMGFGDFAFYGKIDPRQSRKMNYFYSVSEDGRVGSKISMAPYKGSEALWMSFCSFLDDGHAFVTSNHLNAGVLRRPPGAIVRRVLKHDPSELLGIHNAAARLGRRVRADLTIAEVVEYDRRRYHTNVEFQIAIGLLKPEVAEGLTDL